MLSFMRLAEYNGFDNGNSVLYFGKDIQTGKFLFKTSLSVIDEKQFICLIFH